MGFAGICIEYRLLTEHVCFAGDLVYPWFTQILFPSTKLYLK